MASTSSSGGGAAHLFRMLICLCTFGFAYPNAFSENVDTLHNDSAGRTSR